jgi:hypothetical protein
VFLDHLRRPKSDTLGDKNPSERPSSRRAPRLRRVAPCQPATLLTAPAHLKVMTDDRLDVMSGQQVADLFQVSIRTLEEWRQTHKGPPWRRVGKHVRYVRAEVEAWFEGLDSHA